MNAYVWIRLLCYMGIAGLTALSDKLTPIVANGQVPMMRWWDWLLLFSGTTLAMLITLRAYLDQSYARTQGTLEAPTPTPEPKGTP